MLTIYSSNRAEWLAQIMADQLSLDPPDPFERVEVIVNARSVGNWLSEQLAEKNGISANIYFLFPGTHLRQLVRIVLTGDGDEQEDPWRAPSLAWNVLEALPDLLQQNESEALKDWTLNHPCNQRTLNRGWWQLARMIADVFDDYALYRPDRLRSWLSDGEKRLRAPVSTKGESLPQSLCWQPVLARILGQRLELPPFGLQVSEAAEQLRCMPIKPVKLPKKLRLFGLSNMASSQVDLLQALSKVIDVQIFLLTPCSDLWKRCCIRQEQLGDDWRKLPLGANWLLEAPRLESLLGCMGAEFQQILQGSIDSQLDTCKKEDLFAAPATMARNQGREPTLLEQLQQQLTVGESNAPLWRCDSDSSLLFMACPGVLREIQIVRDQILQWLALDSSLEPKDILIMSPQISKFIPFLSSVMNDSATGVQLPWRLIDCNQHVLPGLCKALIDCLETAAGRLTATGLERLLTNPALQYGFGIDPEDLPALSHALQRSGFRWGLDAAERNGSEAHSLLWCLDRWLLGLVLPPESTFIPGGVAPFSEGVEPDRMVHWWQVLTSISQLIYQLRSCRPCREWVFLLNEVINKISKDNTNWSSERSSLLDALRIWQERSSTCALDLDAATVAEILTEELATNNRQFDYRSGTLTVSTLEAMRAIPHRIIILMGLDANVFPRQDKRPGFHIFEHEYRLGDPSPSNRDRYALLEALLSARQHLLITWNSRDERSGEERPAAVPIQQWLSYLVEQLGQAVSKDSKVSFRNLLTKPPANPLDLRNFMANDFELPRCTDHRQYNALRWIQANPIDRKYEGIARPLRWPSDDANEFCPSGISPVRNISAIEIQHWLMAPQRFWLKQLGINIREDDNPIEDLEDLELRDWQRQKLVQSRLEEWLQSPTQENDQMLRSSGLESWSQRLTSCSLSSLNRVDISRLEQSWRSLHSCLLSLGHCRVVGGFLQAGNSDIVVTAGAVSYREIIQGWTHHLQACMKGTLLRNTVVVARCKSDNNSDSYAPLYRWLPLRQEQAKMQWALLQRLTDIGHYSCWPVPPHSGWAMAKEQRNNQSAKRNRHAFISAWDGGFYSQGERQRIEMQVCFGSDCKATDLLDTEIFQRVFDVLYTPLLEMMAT
ncbi:exonuclease V subunit gamma [cyanobiont of Ornithocercus magnificus]|nr:exonuclease V subunit gamma [cyanobiont of Ornithocercus magnificus]